MRRLKLVLGVAALMVVMLVATAAPASAQPFFFDPFDNDFDNNFEDCFFFDGRLICDDGFDRNFFDDFGDVSQDIEQEAESGDVDQSFDVSQTGDNANQTVSTQGVANTGNVQNAIGVSGFGNGGDFEFDEVGSSIEVSPTNITSSDQQVNQAASAFGGKWWW